MKMLLPKVTALCSIAALAGCAPDAWNANSGYDGFLNQVEKACYYKPIGMENVGDIINSPGNMNSVYFLDETSRLYFGKISRDNWTSAVTAFSQGRPSDPGVQCVLDELEKAQAGRVPPPVPK